MFISIDGTNAVGKSTIIASVCDKLESLGYKIYRTKTPSDSDIGRFMRETLNSSGGYAACLINAADRFDTYDNEIVPKLKDGYNVICDRFSFSPYIYNALDGIPFEYTTQVYSKLTKPDLTIILDIMDKSVIIDRVNARKERIHATTCNTLIDRYEFDIEKELDIFDKCVDYFVKTFDNVKVIKVNQDLKHNTDVIVDEIIKVLK